MGFRVNDEERVERFFAGKTDGDSAVLDVEFRPGARLDGDTCRVKAGMPLELAPGVNVQRTPTGLRLILDYGPAAVNHVEVELLPSEHAGFVSPGG